MSIAIIGMILGMYFLSCGRAERPAEKPAAATYLPEKTTAIGWERGPELRVFVGDSLYEYIDGGAELYHSYAFVEVTVADYRHGESEIIADLYRFVNPAMAFGMYTTLRPEKPESVFLGVEGFSSPPALVFTKGDYLVNIVGYDETAATMNATRSIAEAIDSHLPGTTAKPAMFSLFPQPEIIRRTEKMFSSSFLGREYLSLVYTVDCLQDADTVILFVADDDSGGKFAQWSKQTAANRALDIPLGDLPYDGGNSFVIVDNYYGNIVAGLKKKKLAGIIGYNPAHAEFLTGWLNALP